MTDRVERAVRELAAAIREELRAEVARASGPPDLLSVEQVARRLSVGRSSVYALLAAGDLRSLKVGRRRLIPSDALAEITRSAAPSQAALRESSNGVHATTDRTASG